MRQQFLLGQKFISKVIYIAFRVLSWNKQKMFLRPLLIHWELSLLSNACLALWRWNKFFSRILLVGVCVRAGDLLVTAQCRMGFWLITSWYGEKPCTFVRGFLALIAHATAILILLVDSYKILSSISPKIKLHFSKRPMLQGDSVLVNLKFIFIASHMLVKWSLTNSLLLSLRHFSGKPYTRTHNWNILLMMISGFLDIITADAERQVGCSTIYSNMCFL